MELPNSVAGLWTQLAIAAAIILFSSNYLAKSADVIALKTGLGRSFVGVVLLATATSLPEMGLGVSSITLIDAPDLAVGDAFGSNIFNLLIIGILDLFWRNGPILNSVSVAPVVVGILSIVAIAATMIAVFFHSRLNVSLSEWHISPLTIALFLIFVLSMYIVYRSGALLETSEDGAESDEVESDESASGGLPRAVAIYAVAGLVIVVSAVWLANTGEGIAHAMGWETSFVGTQFLAFSTSLPELSASFAALRINAPELAISNLLGSNLFNMGFVLTVDDIALVGKPLWIAVSDVHLMTAALAILMSVVVIVGLAKRGRHRPHKFVTYEGALLIGFYIVTSVLVFRFS